MFRARACIVAALSVLATGAMPQPALAQSAVPTAEQLEMLQSLSPEQRDAVLERMTQGGKDGGGGSSGANGSSSKENNKKNGQAGRAGKRANGKATDEQLDKTFNLEPVLKPDDTVLIAIGFPAPPQPEYVIPPGSPAGTPPIKVPVPEPDPVTQPTPQEKENLERLISLVKSRNPYTLDRNGALSLPGYPPIPLAGLTEEQATQRLMADVSLAQLDVTLTRLPLAPTGLAGLKPFGYDIFEEPGEGFAPVTDMPVPADYVVGPGDQLSVQLYGNQNRSLRLTVGRDGRISFPELGPISVGGRRFESVRADIEGRVQREIIGVRAAVAMGDTRSIRVFVLGDAKQPGSYSVSGLGTVTTALFAAGGVTRIGSLRDVQLKRQGAVVRRLDLYDLLLRGDTSNDAKLQAGDVIFVPPAGATVAIDGEVRRPAIYELRGDVQVADALQLAGGLTSEADTGKATLARVDDQRRRVVVDVDLAAAAGRSALLRNGDALRVPRLRPTLDSGVTVSGHVHSPGAVAWRDGLRLSDVVPSVDDLKPNADLGYLLIRRELPPDRRVVVLSADLSRALRARGSDADPRLSPRDQILVFDLETSREREIQRLLEEIRLQSRIDRPTNIVRVGGRVKIPGDYPLEPNMTVSDLIRAGGNLSDAAYGGNAELTRYTIVDGQARRTALVEIDLAKVLLGDQEADVPLQPFDYLNIKEVPEWASQEQVVLRGEVKFPGTYPIQRGETLASVLARAGGMSDLAFPEGAVFTRKDLQEREQKQLDVLTERLQSDIATMALASAAANQQGAAQASAVGQTLLSQLKSAKAVGRLVIDLDSAAAAGSRSAAGQLVMQDGDQLLIPRRSEEVTVIGEVQNATSHLYRSGLSRDDYVSLSGGMTRKGDDERVYVVRASGSVVSSENSRWFRRGSQIAMKPGDTVVVPLDTERLPTLPFWQAVTQIVYNLAIAAAAVNSF
jgi:protein involved in polysaccharide export with SLBB domain